MMSISGSSEDDMSSSTSDSISGASGSCGRQERQAAWLRSIKQTRSSKFHVSFYILVFFESFLHVLVKQIFRYCALGPFSCRFSLILPIRLNSSLI